MRAGLPAIHETPLMAYNEEIHSTDPLDVRLSFTVEGEILTLRIDDDLQVAEARRER